MRLPHTRVDRTDRHGYDDTCRKWRTALVGANVGARHITATPSYRRRHKRDRTDDHRLTQRGARSPDGIDGDDLGDLNRCRR